MRFRVLGGVSLSGQRWTCRFSDRDGRRVRSPTWDVTDFFFLLGMWPAAWHPFHLLDLVIVSRSGEWQRDALPACLVTSLHRLVMWLPWRKTRPGI
jgi:hypothetical protein